MVIEVVAENCLAPLKLFSLEQHVRVPVRASVATTGDAGTGATILRLAGKPG